MPEPKTCGECKWWMTALTQPPGAVPGAFGYCNENQAMLLLRTISGERVLTGCGFGCNFWKASDA